jgi:4-oxalomesaconate tautomerase
VDYLFAQVVIDKPLVDVSPNCGNMLAGVAPFAIERGLVSGRDPLTQVAIYMVNTGNLARASIQTPGGIVRYDGDAAIAGVPGTGAPIQVDFLDTAGSVCESLLPTQRARARVEGIEVTCIDNGMPVVVIPAGALGKTGYETPAELDADRDFKARLERVRLAAGSLMGLGDVTTKVVPKMTLIAAPRSGGHVCTRTFIPHRCHAAIGVLGAVSVATACVLPGSVAEGIAHVPHGSPVLLSVEHPSGEFTVTLEVTGSGEHFSVGRSGILRTARALMEGSALIAHSIWDGVR